MQQRDSGTRFPIRRVWSEEEDKVLVVLVQQFGSRRWSQISLQFSKYFTQAKRSGKQCRQRYFNYLSPQISKQQLSEKETRRFIKLWLEEGNKWARISRLMPGRSQIFLKNYFYLQLRRAIKLINCNYSKKQQSLNMAMFKNIKTALDCYEYQLQNFMFKMLTIFDGREYDCAEKEREVRSLVEFVRIYRSAKSTGESEDYSISDLVSTARQREPQLPLAGSAEDHEELFC